MKTAFENLASPFLDGELEFAGPAKNGNLTPAAGDSPFAYLPEFRETETIEPPEEIEGEDEQSDDEVDLWIPESADDGEEPEAEWLEHSQDQFVEPAADEEDEITLELDDTESAEEELLETEAPALIEVPAGQTLYVQIALGSYDVCVQRLPNEGTKTGKCVKYKKIVILPMTGIFIPDKYSPQKAVDLILYLHGNKNSIPNYDASIAEYWDGWKHPLFALREVINASGKNVILVAPTMGVLNQAGNLVDRGGLDSYMAKVLEALVTYGPYKNRSLDIGTLVLAAHSGGGKIMRELATSGNTAADKIRECWGFDSLYGDIDPWLGWAKEKQDPKVRALYSYYFPKNSSAAPTVNSRKLQKYDVKNIFTEAYTVKDARNGHFELVRHFLAVRLQDSTLFQKRPAVAPQPTSKELSGEAEDEDFFSDSEFEGEERSPCH